MSRPITVGVLSPFLDGFYYGVLLYELHQAAKKAGAGFIAVKTPYDEPYGQPLAVRHIQGWISVKHEMGASYLQAVKQLNGKVVGIGHTSSLYPCVTFANQESMIASVNHLVASGHTRIAFVGNLTNNSHKERLAGYRLALERHGIPYNPRLVFHVDNFIHRGGHHVAMQLIESGLPCSAIVTCTDLNAIGLMEKLQENGIQVPKDMAIIGHDDTPFATLTTPMLSSVNQSIPEAAETAVRLLLQLIDNRPVSNEPLRIQPKLMVRESCGQSASEQCHHWNEQQQIYNNSRVIRYYENMIDSNRRFNAKLIKGKPDEIKTLSWLESISASWGVLGLWEKEEQAHNRLIIDQIQHRSPLAASMLKQACEVESFPPSDLLSVDESGDYDMICLYPIRTGKKQWGILALGTALDRTRMIYRDDTLWHSLDMLATILEREALYDEIRNNETQYRLITENMSDIICLVDSHGTVKYISPSLKALLGAAPEQYVGGKFTDMLAVEDRAVIQQKLKQIVTERQPMVIEYRGNHVDGRQVIFEAKCTPLYEENEQSNNIIIVARDISDRKKTEELLRKSEKLSVAGQLAASVAHEIRNPLTSIKGLLQYIKSQTKNHHEFFEVMLSELDRINFILSELMMLAKPQIAQFKRQDVVGIIQNVISLLSTQLHISNIRLVTRFDEELPHVHCDENQLKQVFINIMKNAIEAMPYGGEIVVDIMRHCPDYIKISIRDQGIGIAEENLPKLSEPFYTTKEKGTGLGLMVSFQIIEAHRGIIQIKSEVNKGTSVEIRLPL